MTLVRTTDTAHFYSIFVVFRCPPELEFNLLIEELKTHEIQTDLTDFALGYCSIKTG